MGGEHRPFCTPPLAEATVPQARHAAVGAELWGRELGGSREAPAAAVSVSVRSEERPRLPERWLAGVARARRGKFLVPSHR